jgi:putative transposase
MIIRKAFKFRLKLTPEQERLCNEFGGQCRFVWNRALALQKERLKNKASCLGFGKLCKENTAWRNSEETAFLSRGPVHAQQQKLKDLTQAISDAFDRTQPDKKFPKFKKKHNSTDSFRFPDKEQFEVDRLNGRAKLPKIGWVRWFKGKPCGGSRRQIEGEVNQMTLRKEHGQWMISFSCSIEVGVAVHPSNTAVGGDLVVNIFLALSDGATHGSLHVFKKLERKLVFEQRKLARMNKLSNNWKKQKRKTAKIHKKIANCRYDYLHKLTTEISKNHAVIALEDLRVKNMSASAKGTVEKPGRNVQQKAALNKSILDQGWGTFRLLVEYKQAHRGGELILVDPSFTSQTCSECGHVSDRNRKSQARFVCEACGFDKNADVNAAINILKRAVGHTERVSSACGGAGLRTPDEAGTNRDAA